MCIFIHNKYAAVQGFVTESIPSRLRRRNGLYLVNTERAFVMSDLEVGRYAYQQRSKAVECISDILYTQHLTPGSMKGSPISTQRQKGLVSQLTTSILQYTTHLFLATQQYWNQQVRLCLSLT